MGPEGVKIALAWPRATLAGKGGKSLDRAAWSFAEARKSAFKMTRHALPVLNLAAGERLGVEFCFVPPDGKRYSLDKLAARTEAASLGIADSLGLGRAQLECTFRISPVPMPGGRMLVCLRRLSPPGTASQERGDASGAYEAVPLL